VWHGRAGRWREPVGGPLGRGLVQASGVLPVVAVELVDHLVGDVEAAGDAWDDQALAAGAEEEFAGRVQQLGVPAPAGGAVAEDELGVLGVFQAHADADAELLAELVGSERVEPDRAVGAENLVHDVALQLRVGGGSPR